MTQQEIKKLMKTKYKRSQLTENEEIWQTLGLATFLIFCLCIFYKILY